MKLLIASDIHGSAYYCRKLLEAYEREEADRLAIIEGLRDGTIDMIATDHAPHSAEEKAKSLTEAPSGIIGLETALSLGIRELVDKGYLSMMELIGKMSLAPAKLSSRFPAHAQCSRDNRHRHHRRIGQWNDLVRAAHTHGQSQPFYDRRSHNETRRHRHGGIPLPWRRIYAGP